MTSYAALPKPGAASGSDRGLLQSDGGRRNTEPAVRELEPGAIRRLMGD